MLFRLAFLFVALCGGIAVAAQQDVEQLEQQALYDAASMAAPYVVRIETIGGLEKVGRVLVNMGPTSGVIVDPDGYIVSSAFNFIQEPNSILVQLPNGDRKAAKIVSRDHSRRLVLLKVDVDEPLEVPHAVAKEDVRIGQWAVTVGRTLPGDAFNMSVGIISANNRIWGKAIQTDANVSPANYGGALVDVRGNIVGVLAPLSPDSNAVIAGAEWYDSGIGFCIAFEDILANLDRLKEGDAYSGKLGVAMKGTDSYGDELVVALSRPKSPAREAGINKGDKVLSVNGVRVNSHAQMKHVLGPLLAGETVRIGIDRDGETISKEIVLTDKLLPYEHAFLGILPARRANLLAEDGDEAPGVLVRYVYPESPAAKLGIEVDDRVLEFNGDAVSNTSELRNAIASVEPNDDAAIKYQSGDEENEVSVTLSSLPSDVPAELPETLPDVDEFNDDLPQLGKINVKLPEEEGDCVAYVPESYDPRFEHSLLVILPVPGKDKSQDLIDSWKPLSDETRTILLMPSAKEARSWLPTETAFIRKTIENLRKDYLVDAERIAVYGADNSGSMAFLTAFTHRDLIRGVASLNAAVPSRAPMFVNEPLQRFAAFIIGPKSGRSTIQIDANVKALEESKAPVTQHKLDEAKLSPDLQKEMLRWLDTLDRI